MANLAHTVIVKQAGALSPAERDAWAQMCADNPALYSPYFHPDYTALVGELRDDAFVAIVSQADTPIAFLPFQTSKPGRSGMARPIGTPMTDYHGFIKSPDTQIDPKSILKAAGIGAFHFNSALESGAPLSPFIRDTSDCTMMDLSGGTESWRQERDSSYRRHLKSNRRRIRKAEEDIGPRRFVYQSQDRDVFETLLTWKRGQLTQSGKYDVLSVDWVEKLLTQLWDRGPDAELRADMHVLYFGDRIAAIDLGLTDTDTFHSWIIAYDAELQSYGPGIQLLEGMIDEAATLGYSRIDLGVGIDGYKRHYASDPIVIGEGFVPVQGGAALMSNLYGSAEKFGQKALKDIPSKFRRRYAQVAACEDTASGRMKAMLDAVKHGTKS